MTINTNQNVFDWWLITGVSQQNKKRSITTRQKEGQKPKEQG